MNKNLFYLTVIVYLNSCGIAKLTNEEAVDDVHFMQEQLVEVHPDLFLCQAEDSLRYNLKQKIDYLRAHYSTDQKELYCMLNPIVASLNDGHTRLEPPRKVTTKSFFWGSKVIPLKLDLVKEDLIISESYSKDIAIPRGARLIKINEIEVEQILKQLKVNKYGMNPNFRNSYINYKTLPRDLWMFCDMNGSFKVDYVDNGDTIKVSLKGVSQPYLYRKMKTSRCRIEKDVLFEQSNACFYHIDSHGVGYIKYEYCQGAKDSIFFDNVFTYANDNSLAHLILDLRDNRGGSTEVYSVLIPHLTNDTIRPFEKVEYKVSEQLIRSKVFGEDYTYPSTNDVGQIKDIDATDLCIYPKGKQIFRGELHCLCNAGTFSTASSLVAVLKDNELARIVGMPTGGLGTSFGNFLRIELPNSQIQLLVSTAKYYRGNKNHTLEPIKPDIMFDCDFMSFDELINKIAK